MGYSFEAHLLHREKEKILRAKKRLEESGWFCLEPESPPIPPFEEKWVMVAFRDAGEGLLEEKEEVFLEVRRNMEEIRKMGCEVLLLGLLPFSLKKIKEILDKIKEILNEKDNPS